MRKKYKGFKLSYGRVRGRKANVKEVKREKERRRRKTKKKKVGKKEGADALKGVRPQKIIKTLITSQPMPESLPSIHLIVSSASWFIPYRRIRKALPLIIHISL